MARQIAEKYPTDTAEGLMAFARDPELMASDPEMAAKAMAQAQAMQTQAAALGKTQADARKSTSDAASKEFELSPAGRADKLAQSGKFTSPSIANFIAGKGDLEAIDKFTKPTADFIAKANELGFGDKPRYGDYSAPQTGLVNSALLKDSLSKATANKSISTVNLPPQEKKEQQDRGALLVSQYKDVSSQAAVAAKSLPSLESQLMIMDKADFSTGFGTTTIAAGARILGALGVADAEKFATNAQSFTGMAAQAVLTRQLEQKGPQTEADAARITQTGAQLGNTKEANRFLVDVAKAQFQRDLKQRSFYDKWFTKNKTYDGAEDAWFTTGEGGLSLFASEGLKKYVTSASAASQIPSQSAVAPPARQAPQAAQAPQYATNPSTGQRIMSMDGGSTWQPRR
jgi:hypothetical protein